MRQPFSILLIDDDADIADLLIRAARSGFPQARFMVVSSFEEAALYMNGLTGRGPRLVLLDADLRSAFGGLDFLAQLRQHPQGRLLPVVMLSGSVVASQVQAAYQLGISAYTRKPQSLAEWKAYVERLRQYWYESVTVPALYFKPTSD